MNPDTLYNMQDLQTIMTVLIFLGCKICLDIELKHQ